MKKSALILSLIFLISSFGYAQDIPNAGFENWTNDEPDSWITTKRMEKIFIIFPNFKSIIARL